MPRKGMASGTSLLGTGRLALATTVARRFYLDGASKVQIAHELGVSRFKVARLLEAARSAGLVQISVGMPSEVDEALSERLRQTFGLQYALVIAAGGPSRVEVGRMAADLLGELTSPDDIVGLAWGRTMSEVARFWTDHVPATFVQLVGALARADVVHNAPDLVQSVAAAAGGTASVFYAPLLMPDAGSAEAMRQHTGVRETLALMDRLTRAVVSVGAWLPGESTTHDALEPSAQQALRDRGVVAEVCGLLFTADGTVVGDLADRILSITEHQIRSTPQVIGLASGEERAQATAAALRSGLISALVTDAAIARRILG